MKINYEILWFEDHPDSVEPHIQSIHQFLDASGFTLKLEMRATASTSEIDILAEKVKEYNKYDLIVFDYDLGVSEKGSEIAKKLRTSIFTDMIFYSGTATATLREILYKGQVDGVFVVDRTTLAEEMEPILDDFIKKTCDINNMKGVVMDELSRFDHLMRSKCEKILTSAPSAVVDASKKYLSDEIKGRGNTLIKKSDKITNPIATINDRRLADFDLIRRKLARLIPSENENLKDGSPLHNMQVLRNRLAHVKNNLEKEGEITLDDNPKEVFNYAKFRSIRCELREIAKKLTALESMQ